MPRALHPPSAADTDQATLAEVFAQTAVDGAATGFVLAHLPRKTQKPVLWVQDHLSRREAGRPCLAGLPAGVTVLYVAANRAADALWAMEEGLLCNGLSAVIGELWGDPPALDFTATKRLALRAEAQAVPAWLIRRAAATNLSAARLRWRVGSLPALADPHDARAPGQPLWQADLFRARWRTPGRWVAHDDGNSLVFSHDIGPAVGDDTALPHHAAG